MPARKLGMPFLGLQHACPRCGAGSHAQIMVAGQEKVPRRAVVDAVLATGLIAGAARPAEAKGKTVKAGEWARHQASNASARAAQHILRATHFQVCARADVPVTSCGRASLQTPSLMASLRRSLVSSSYPRGSEACVPLALSRCPA